MIRLIHLRPILLLAWFATLQVGAAEPEDFSIVALVDCDQKAKAVVVSTLRDRENIGDARIREMAKSHLISVFLSSESHTKAIFLYTRTKEGSRSQGIWIRDGKLLYEGKKMEVGEFLEHLGLRLPNPKTEEVEQAAP